MLKRFIYFALLGLCIMQCTQNTTITDMDNTHFYGLHGKLIASDGKAEELAGILLEASALMSSAEGCRLYVVSMDATNPNEVWVTEIWESREDHANSLQVEGVRELIAKAIPLLDGSPQKGQELQILGGLGL